MRIRWQRVFGLAAALLAISPAGAQAFSKAVWGDVYRNGVNQFPLYHRLGARIFEMDLAWYQVAPRRPRHPANPRDPAYRWPVAVQQAIAQGHRYHIQVLLQIIGAPRWANGGHNWQWAPHPADYATFAGAAARRYPSVHLWMVWGEPSRKPNWEPEVAAKPGATLDKAQQVAPHNYARMLDAAYGALKGASRANVVIGGNTYTAGDIDTQQWIENLRLPNGRPPRLDMYGHNPFSWRPPAFSSSPSPGGEVMIADLKRLGSWIDRYLHRGIPIFLSEYTIPTSPDQEFGFYASPSAQAQLITQTLKTVRSWSRIFGLGWIHIYDNPPVSYGGLVDSNGVPKPGLAAFQHG